MNEVDFETVAGLPEDFQPFDMFYIDMGEFFNEQIGPMTEEQTQLFGVPLWKVERKTKDKSINEKTQSTDDLRRLAKVERKWRSQFMAFALEKEDLEIEDLVKILGSPKYVDWQDS